MKKTENMSYQTDTQKKWAGQGCHFIAKKGTEISDLEAKEYGIAKETKAKEPKENKAK